MSKATKPKMPITPEEWQLAVDLAEGAIAVTAARAYGIITGGPDIDCDRCEEILAEGAKRGYLPAPNAIEKFTTSLSQ